MINLHTWLYNFERLLPRELLICELCLQMIWRILLLHFSYDLNYSRIGSRDSFFIKFLFLKSILDLKVITAVVNEYLKEPFEWNSLICWLLLTFSEEIFFKDLTRIATNYTIGTLKKLRWRNLILYRNAGFSGSIHASFICHCDFLHRRNSDKSFRL